MKLALGIYEHNINKTLSQGKAGLKTITEVLDLDIGHYCYSSDEERTVKGVKEKQHYFIDGTDIKAVTKTFEESTVIINGKENTQLNVTFEYYNWPYKNDLGETVEEVGAVKTVKKILSEKQYFFRQRRQRDYSIRELESLGFQYEALGDNDPINYPQLVNYSQAMNRIFSFFQNEINSFIAVNSPDFKNKILEELQGTNTQLINDLNILLPTTDDDGNPILIETWKGILWRL